VSGSPTTSTTVTAPAAPVVAAKTSVAAAKKTTTTITPAVGVPSKLTVSAAFQGDITSLLEHNQTLIESMRANLITTSLAENHALMKEFNSTTMKVVETLDSIPKVVMPRFPLTVDMSVCNEIDRSLATAAGEGGAGGGGINTTTGVSGNRVLTDEEKFKNGGKFAPPLPMSHSVPKADGDGN
jgi:hypothetical protein